MPRVVGQHDFGGRGGRELRRLATAGRPSTQRNSRMLARHRADHDGSASGALDDEAATKWRDAGSSSADLPNRRLFLAAHPLGRVTVLHVLLASGPF